MRLAVVKTGPKCDSQRDYIERLSLVAPERTPRLLGSWEDGYAMEMLESWNQNAPWPQLVERALDVSIWSQKPLLGFVPWKTELEATLGIVAPDWTWRYDRPCAVHGDPTLCNTMMRMSPASLVLVDPAKPTRVPQIAATDQARIVQSMMGWEIMTGYHSESVVWNWPKFLLTENHTEIAILNFWVYVMMSRIASSLNVSASERAWADHLRVETGAHACSSGS